MRRSHFFWTKPVWFRHQLKIIEQHWISFPQPQSSAVDSETVILPRPSSEAVSSASLGTGLAFSEGLVTSGSPCAAPEASTALGRLSAPSVPSPAGRFPWGLRAPHHEGERTGRRWDWELGPSPHSGLSASIQTRGLIQIQTQPFSLQSFGVLPFSEARRASARRPVVALCPDKPGGVSGCSAVPARSSVSL